MDVLPLPDLLKIMEDIEEYFSTRSMKRWSHAQRQAINRLSKELAPPMPTEEAAINEDQNGAVDPIPRAAHTDCTGRGLPSMPEADQGGIDRSGMQATPENGTQANQENIGGMNGAKTQPAP